MSKTGIAPSNFLHESSTSDTRAASGDTLEQALEYVISINLYRRHLKSGQAAAVGTVIAEELAKFVKAGNPHRGEDGTFTTSGKLSGSGEESSREEVPSPRKNPIADRHKSETREVAGSRVGVSGRSIQTAAKIKDEASDLFEQMKEGELFLNAAKNALAIRTGTQMPASTRQEGSTMDTANSRPA